MAEQSVQSLRDAVDAAIANSGPAIVGKVTSHYVDAEIERRAKLLVTGVDAVRQAETDLKKVDKPDVTHLNGDGTVAAEHYTKGKIDEIKKARERLDRLTKALDMVLADHSAETYKKLDEAIKKGGSKGGASEQAE